MKAPSDRSRNLRVGAVGLALALAGAVGLSAQDPAAGPIRDAAAGPPRDAAAGPPRDAAAGPIRGGAAEPARETAAGATAPLGLGEAVARALDHDPGVGASRAASAAAHAEQGRTKAAWWPELGLTGSLTRYEEPMVVSPIHDFTPGETPAFDETLIRGGGYLRWTIFDGGARGARIRRARWEASAAEAELDAAAQALVAEVAVTYLDVLSETRLLAAHDRRLGALEAERDRVGQLREVGRAAEVEVFRAEAALASARADRVDVESGLDVARRELARLVGAPPEEPGERGLVPLRLATVGVPAREELVARAVAASPAVERARRLRTAAEAGLSLARSARWPDLRLLADWIDHAGIDSDHNLEWSAGVQLALPVFTGGRIDEGVTRATAEARAAGERLRLAVRETERAVDRAVSRIEAAASRVRSLEIAADRSREVVRIERLRLETGTGTQTDYLDAEADLLSVEAALTEARHAHIRARVELARAAGRLGPEWVEENLEGEG